MKKSDNNIKIDLNLPKALTDEQIKIMLDYLRNEPNFSCDKTDLMKQYDECYGKDETIYDDILSLIEKGKQQGLKIVVTFEKL